MWLIISILAAIIATVMWKFIPEVKIRLDSLAIMLWGMTLMILVDHVLGYEGGAFFEVETDGLISSGAFLGILMLIPVLAVWAAYVAFTVRQNNSVKE